jgi:hypothetical protein
MFALDYLRVPGGHGVRKPLRLRPWQRALIAATWDQRPAPRLARHIGNAVLREGVRGACLAKERTGSPRMIEAAVASVMAHDRAAALTV